MGDEPAGTEILNLGDFPPVATEQWEAAIRADLKGADYDKKLVWRTE
jgi:methylmalonyl-CoA mutase